MKRVFRLLALLFLVWLAFEFWTVGSGRPHTTLRPLPSHFKRGVYHVHSTLSDGQGTVKQIADAAARQGLQFVILADHGRPNRAAATATGWQGDVLMIGGSELSVGEGHLAATGFCPPDWHLAPEGAQACLDVERLSGVTFVAHPFDRAIPWRAPDDAGATGIEIISAYQQVRQVPWYRLLRLPVQYLLSPGGAQLHLLREPRRELAWWDRMLERRQVFGIYALDAHGPLPVLGIPSYRAMFSLLTVYVQSNGPLDRDPGIATAGLIGALRAGRFFSAIEALAPANGFDSCFLTTASARFETGATVPAGIHGDLIWEIPADFPVEIRVIRNGRLWRTISTHGAGRQSCPVGEPGVYRSEVHPAEGPFRDLPWILTNPVRLLPPSSGETTPPTAPRTGMPAVPLDLTGPVVEKNDASAAALSWTADGRAVLDLTVRPERAGDSWVALAWHRPADWGKYPALRIEVRTNRPTRLGVQVRCGAAGQEGRFQRSIFCSPDGGAETVPFTELRSLPGTSTAFDATRVTALYLLADPDLLGNLAPLHLEIAGLELAE